MAITNGYLSLDEARGYILPNGADTDDDIRIEIAVEAASRAIDEFCRRRFYTATETRYYTPSDGSLVFVDDLVSVTTLKTDAGGDGTFETTWAASDYNLGPYNANTDGRPYTKIERAHSGSYAFPDGVRRSVEIAGSFGWPSVPSAVKQACAIQAQTFFKRATEGGAPIVSMDGGTMPSSSKYLDRSVELLVRPYRRRLVA